MMKLNRRATLIGALVALPMSACGSSSAGDRVTVHKDPNCGCCQLWIEHLQRAGFRVDVRNTVEMYEVKAKLGVPSDLASCHTAEVAGYAVEGHVPVSDIQRLLRERPKGAGIAVAGMPVNSPGMEVEGAPDEPYVVWLFTLDGARSVFARHGEG